MEVIEYLFLVSRIVFDIIQNYATFGRMDNIVDNLTFYFPKTLLSNYDLSQEFNTSEEKIFKKTGIKNRYISGHEELASDMAFNAIESFFKTNAITTGRNSASTAAYAVWSL